MNKKAIIASIGASIALIGSGSYYGYSAYEKLEDKNKQLQQHVVEKDKSIKEQRKMIEEKVADIKEKDKAIEEKDNNIKSLNTEKSNLQEQVTQKDGEIGDLKKKLAEQEQARQEAQRLALQKQEEAKKLAAQQKQVAAKATPAPAPKQMAAPTPKQETQKAPEGKTVTVQATAYTADPAENGGTYGGKVLSKMGHDLSANPNMKMIAVDPNVIPLGSKVWVEGYGEAIAGDTGGAIKGNRIDVLMGSKSESSEWGRKNNVQVKILDN